jgi:hypothetical protein
MYRPNKRFENFFLYFNWNFEVAKVANETILRQIASRAIRSENSPTFNHFAY